MNIDKIIKQMSIKEKIGQLSLTGSNINKTKDFIKNEHYGSVLNHCGVDHINNLQKLALDNNQGIPLLVGDDVIHGYRSVYPVPIGLSNTFNLELIERAVRMSTEEASTEGINWIYSPMLDLTHEIRWGRVMETGGEDPYLSSLIGQAFVKGIQKPLKDGRITAACAKHYVGYGAVEAGIDYNTTDFSEYRLRKLYLPTFKKAIDEGVFSVMNDFTTYNGKPVTASKYLLKDVLRDELGFTGCVVTDWGCISQLPKHRVVKDDLEASALSISLGIDIDMQSDCYSAHLEKAINDNPILMKKLDESVKRVLEMKNKMGLFEHPYVLENAYQILSEENRRICLEAAEESMVLLKNTNNVLPISENEKILLVGPYLEETESHLGSWSCKGKKEDVVSVKEAFANQKNIKYLQTSFECNEVNSNEFREELTKIANEVDKIIALVGEPRYMSGENNNRLSIELPFEQLLLIRELKKLNKPLITVVTAGRPLALEEVNDLSDSLIFTYQLGIEAGKAYYNILTGKTNPSGKLTMTFPRCLGQVPIYYNRFSTGRSELVHYVDGTMEPLYYFGDGIHYGELSITNMEPSLLDNKLKVSFNLKNDSKYPIKEVMQVYLHIPYYHDLRPTKELIGFKKILVNEKTEVSDQIIIDLKEFLPNDLSTDSVVIMVGPSSNNLTEFKVRITDENR